MKTSFLFKLILILYISQYCQSIDYYWTVRPAGKPYFYQYWRGIGGAFKLLLSLRRHPLFGKDRVLRSWMRRILTCYIMNRGVFYILSIRLFFTIDPKLNPNYTENSIYNVYDRRLEEISDEDKEKANMLQKAFKTNAHKSEFFEVGAESVTPIICLGTEEGNIPGKLIDMEKPIYVSNGEVKTCPQFSVVPETRLVYHHQAKDYNCGPRGHNTLSHQRLWNAVYFGENGNILGEADLNMSTITYIEDGEVKTSHNSFAVIC